MVDVDWAAQLPTGCALDLYDEWQVAPTEGDIVHVGVDTRPVTSQYCYDADMLVVPSTYATFVAKFHPMLQVRHMAMTANGQKVLTASTFMVPEPHVRSMAFRLHTMDSSASNMSIPLVGFSESRLEVWWKLCEQKGLLSVSPTVTTLRQANGYMDQFMELWKNELGFIAIHNMAGSHFTMKKPAVLQVHPGGEAAPWTDADKAKHAKSLAVVQEMEALRMGDLVPVCTPMAKMAELTDYWGYYGSGTVVLDQEGVFYQIADILLFMVGTGLARGGVQDQGEVGHGEGQAAF